MLTIEALRAYGADVDEGLTRCMNNEAFYLRMVGMAVADGKIADLEAAIGAGDLAAAFETAHALKGMYSNLSLTPVARPMSEITELLRARTETDYHPLLDEIRAQKAALDALAE